MYTYTLIPTDIVLPFEIGERFEAEVERREGAGG